MFDIVIKGGTLYDGSGSPEYVADIGILNGQIACIGKIDAADAGKVIHAEGKAVTPGFIDPHTHADLDLLIAPDMEPFLMQGVTTVVAGNCGHAVSPQGTDYYYCVSQDEQFAAAEVKNWGSGIPFLYERDKAAAVLKKEHGIDLDWHGFWEYYEKCQTLTPGCNVAPLVGYSAVRAAVMGKDSLRAANAVEQKRLEAEVQAAMEGGAFGLSTGRDPHYVPGSYASDEEMIGVLGVVKQYDGIFASHTYNSKDGVPDRLGGYREMFRQAMGAGVKANVSHVHVLTMAETEQDGLRAADETLKLFDRAKADGLDLTYDVIPSTQSADFTHGSIGFFFRPLLEECKSRKELAEKLSLPAFRQETCRRIKEGEIMPFFNPNSKAAWFRQLTVVVHRNASLVGKTLQAIAKMRDADPLEAMFDIFCEDPDMIVDFISPALQKTADLFLSQPEAMPCSDGLSYSIRDNLTGNHEVPIYINAMNAGYIPFYLSRLDKIFGNDTEAAFAKAVRKATSQVAERFAISGRGCLALGYNADIVIIDRQRLQAQESYILQPPKGIDYVLVNGQVRVEKGCLTGKRSGCILRRDKRH